MHRERPSRGTAEQRDELAANYSITSSARCWRNQDTSRPSALASLEIDEQLEFRRSLHR
jgi:hypothetical protein